MFDVERLPSEAAAIASFARHVSWRQEIHFQLDDAGAFATRAPAFLAVERESARSITSKARFGRFGEELANIIEKTNIRCRRRARRASDGRLVHFVNSFDQLVASEMNGLVRDCGSSPSFQARFERR